MTQLLLESNRRIYRVCRWRGQNSLATFAAAVAPSEIPPEAAPPAAENPAGCHALDTKPAPTAPLMRPDATAFFPVVVFRVITVLTSACLKRGPKPRSVDL
jgi:hypothetical protein